jgi:hypothetical protein
MLFRRLDLSSKDCVESMGSKVESIFGDDAIYTVSALDKEMTVTPHNDQARERTF